MSKKYHISSSQRYVLKLVICRKVTNDKLNEVKNENEVKYVYQISELITLLLIVVKSSPVERLIRNLKCNDCHRM